MTEADGAPAAPMQPVVFTGTRGELTHLVVVNTLLTIVTLGIYRFWAKTRIRDYYWRHTVVGGDPFEYTGNGKELFLGFLIVMVVLGILSVIVATLQQVIAFGNLVAAQMVDLVIYVVVAWLLGYAVYRARRYRLTRTLWRGIRFGQDGSPMRYAWLRFGWLLLLVVTLGVVRPWYEVSLRRFEMTHTRFGFTGFDYAGQGRDLMRYWWPALLALLVVLAGAAMVAFQVWQAVAASNLPEDDGFAYRQALETAIDHGISSPAAVTGFAVSAAGFFVFILFNARYRIAALRYLFAVSSLKGVTARSDARLRRVMLYAVSAYGMIALAFAFSALMAALADGLGVLLMVLTFVAMSPIVQIFFVYPLVRHIASTLETTDLAALDDVVQATRDDPRFGEGLLDALDFDMGVV